MRRVRRSRGDSNWVGVHDLSEVVVVGNANTNGIPDAFRTTSVDCSSRVGVYAHSVSRRPTRLELPSAITGDGSGQGWRSHSL